MARSKKPDDPNAPKCLVGGCDGKAKWKGICPTCYAGAKQMIEQEKTTWVELQELGLVEGPSIIARFTELKGKTRQPSLFDHDKIPVNEPEPPAQDGRKVIGFFDVEKVGLMNAQVLARLLGVPPEDVQKALDKFAEEKTQ